MPNKDSFTFSDKLRKTKSVPLSKRLPSIVGGQNKQKRTLVQRAQRDLPFILVAALALLLLPFLSRTGSDDIASTGDLAWNTMADDRSFMEGSGNEIMPAGSMSDPLDLILRPRSAVETSGVTAGSGADATKNAYGSGSDSRYGDGSGSSYSRRSRDYSSSGSSSSSSRPDYSTRKSYDEQYTTKTTKAPATTKYGAKTRPSIRKSFERKGTEIKALRTSQMPSNKGATGIGHSLPIGQGPTRTPNTSFREGVRPVALQRMESQGGVGRRATGENLYAEASRSIGAMNTGGPAKSNLLAAQLRDVDGRLTPEGPGFGGSGATGSGTMPGSSGGPNNQNGYSVQKPWWWDMMQTRSQKMWELLYYKPREIWYTNMYNYASQLMNCLFTGNKDGDVSTMFGKGASDSDWMCVRDGKEIMVRYNKQKTKKTKDKDGNSTEETIDSDWFLTCDKRGGETIEKKKDAKSFLDVRAECVGLDVVIDWLKDIIKHTNYDSDCSGINNDPAEFTLNISRANAKGKHNTKREEKLQNRTVIALLAKTTENTNYSSISSVSSNAGATPSETLGTSQNITQGTEFVVYIQNGNKLSSAGQDLVTAFRNGDYKNCKLTKLVAFTSKKGSETVSEYVGEYNADQGVQSITPIADYEVSYNASYDERKGRRVYGTEKGEFYVQNRDGSQYVNDYYGRPFSANELGKEVGQIDAALAACKGDGSISKVKPFTLSDLQSKAELGKSKETRYAECKIWENRPTDYGKKLNGEQCENCCEKPIDIKQTSTFEATINNTKDKRVYAVMVDQIDQETKAIVSYIVDFGTGDNGSNASLGLRNCRNDGTCHFKFIVNAASLGIALNDFGNKIATGYSNSSSSRSSTRSEQANTKMGEGVTSNNASAQAMLKTCTDACASITDAKEKQTCISNCANSYRPTTGSYQSDSESSSDGSNANTARGSGIIFWLVTDPGTNLKVKKGDEIAEDLHAVKVSDLVEAKHSVAYDLCRYRWCNDIGSCSVNDPIPSEYCKDTATNQVYIAHKTTVNGNTAYIKDEELGPQTGIPSDNLPNCDPLCVDGEGNVHECNPDGTPTPIVKCPLSDIDTSYQGKIKPCYYCCEYEGTNYKSINVNGKYYIVDATPGFCTNPNGTCTVAAWSEENSPFAVYGLPSTYDPNKLALIPDTRYTIASSGTLVLTLDRTTLVTHVNDFNVIHRQSSDPAFNSTRDPRLFRLFPKLELPNITVDLSPCMFCGESLYENASVEANATTIATITDNVRACYNKLSQLETILGETDPDIIALKNMYFYGYASKRGSHNVEYIATSGPDSTIGCTTNGGNTTVPKAEQIDDNDPKWGYCNKALSEDRNLYIMKGVINGLSGFEINADITSKAEYRSYNGFTNTKPVGTMISNGRATPKYRLVAGQYPTSTGSDYNFVSWPCGSDGAAADHKADKNSDDAKRDRLVLISPIHETGRDYCDRRMTCEESGNKLTEMAERMTTKLQNLGVTVQYVPINSEEAVYPMAFGGPSDADFGIGGDLVINDTGNHDNQNDNPLT